MTFAVTSSTVGVQPNTTSGVTTTQTPTAGAVSNTANLTVTGTASPTITKSFNPTSIGTGFTSVVTLTLSNSNSSALTSATFTDHLVNMSIAANTSVGGTCGAGPASLGGAQPL